MSKFEQRNNEGSLWKNKKPKNEKSPPYKGQCKLDDIEYWINAWINDFGGDKYFKLKFTPKGQREEQRSTGGNPLD